MGILTSSQSPGGSSRGGGATTLFLTATVTSLMLLNYVASSTSARVSVKCMSAGPCTEHLSSSNNANPGSSNSSSKYTQEHMREMYTELFKQKILDALRLPSAGGNGSASSSHRHGNGDGGSHGYRSSSTRSSVLVNRTVVIPASQDAQPDPRHPLYTNYNPAPPLASGGVVGGASDRASVASLPLSERLIQNLTAFAWTQWHRPSKESVSVSQGESRGQGHDKTATPSPERRNHANNNSSSVNVVSPLRKSQLVIPLNSKPAGKQRQSSPPDRPGKAQTASSRARRRNKGYSRSRLKQRQGGTKGRYVSIMRFRLNVDSSSIGRLQLLIPIRYRREATVAPDPAEDQGHPRRHRRWRRSRRRTIHLTVSLRLRGQRQPRYVTVTSLRTTLRHSKWLNVPLPASVMHQRDPKLTLRLACEGCSRDLHPLTAALSARRTVTGAKVSAPTQRGRLKDSVTTTSHGDEAAASSHVEYSNITDDIDIDSDVDAAHRKLRRRKRKYPTALLESDSNSNRHRRMGRRTPVPYIVVKMKD